jgi:hypothetical protein
MKANLLKGVVYATISRPKSQGRLWLDKAVSALLSCVSSPGEATLLWSMHYSQMYPTQDSEDFGPRIDGQSITFSSSNIDLAFDDNVLREVRKAWQHVTGEENGFMQFEDRELGEYDDDDDY